MSEKYNDDNVKRILESEKVPERLEPENIKKMLDSGNHAEKRKKIRHKKLLRIVSAAAAFAVVFGTSFYLMKPIYENNLNMKEFSGTDSVIEVTDSASDSLLMKPASGYSDVYSYFRTASNVSKIKDILTFGFTNKDVGIAGGIVGEQAEEDMFDGGSESNEAIAENYVTNGIAVPETGSGESESKEFSDTYSQEEGVLEADIVKTDGNSIFYSNGDTLYITQTDKGKFVNPSKTVLSEKLGLNSRMYIEDMYIYNNRLIVISTCWDENYGRVDYENDKLYMSEAYTYVTVFDVSGEPTVLNYYMQEGNYNDVRLMADGYLYLVTNAEKYVDFKNTPDDDFESYIPEYCVGTQKCYIEPTNIMIPACEIKEVYDYISYTNISGLDLNSENPCQPVDMKSIAGYTNNIYCSQQNLYVVSGYDESEITRFAVNDGTITPVTSGKVKGYVNDQFSMSEYNGYFRIAVTENVWEESTESAGEDRGSVSGGEESDVMSNILTQKNSVYVLDMDMNVVGSIGDFGINEHIKSVNFSGDTAYVVTFRQTDPLYAIDLSNPEEPVILDEFKISGYSSYMQNWTDGLLLGFGAAADEETGIQTGIKMTMFDNSDPNNLKELNTVSIIGNEEEYADSEGIYERKALYIDPDKNIIGFPVEKWNYLNEYTVLKDSYQFYSFENGSFVYKGAIESVKNGYDYEPFRRVVYIDGYFYAVAADEFISADAVSFAETDKVAF